MSDQRLRRAMTLAILGVAGVAIILAFLPGVDVYRDGNDCFGEALGNLFSSESRHRTCTPAWHHVGTAMSGGPWLALVVLGASLPALIALRWPRWGWLIAGSVLSIASAWLVLIWFAFGPGGILSEQRYVLGWPYWLLVAALVVLHVLQILGVPVAAIVAYIRSRPRPPELPVARTLTK